MTKEQVLGLVRHTLTFVGGVLIAKGLITEQLTQEIIGGVITITGAIWSLLKNKA